MNKVHRSMNFSVMTLVCMNSFGIVEPTITAILYSGHFHVAATFNRSLLDFPYYNLPVYNGHVDITAI